MPTFLDRKPDHQVITDKLRDDDDAASIENDWKFAAMVRNHPYVMFVILSCAFLSQQKMQIVIFHHVIDIHVDDVDHGCNNLGA